MYGNLIRGKGNKHVWCFVGGPIYNLKLKISSSSVILDKGKNINFIWTLSHLGWSTLSPALQNI